MACKKNSGGRPKRGAVLMAAAMALAVLTGCSHNIGTAFSGKLINLGYDPEMHKVGIQYYDGVMVTGVNRENSKHTMNFESSGEAQNGETSVGGTKTKLEYSSEIGHQATGYLVEAIEAGADQDKLYNYLKAEEKPAEK